MRSATIFLVLAMVVGCSKGDGDVLDGHCVYGRPPGGEQYCETTFIEMIASPRIFDGENVRVRGWVVRIEDQIVFYPFPEYVGRGFSNASISIEVDSSPAALQDRFFNLAEGGAWQSTVTGKFIMLRGAQSDAEIPRLGKMRDISSVFP